MSCFADLCYTCFVTCPAKYWIQYFRVVCRYVKTHKTASSTLAGVMRNICGHYGITPVRRDLLRAAQARNQVQAGPIDTANLTMVQQAVELAYNAREQGAVAIVDHLRYSEAKQALLPQPLLKFTSVRHPMGRVHSHVFHKLCYKVSRAQGLDSLSNHPCHDFDASSTFGQQVLASYTPRTRWKHVRAFPTNHVYNYIRGNAATVDAALQHYDFVFVTERMDEGENGGH